MVRALNGEYILPEAGGDLLRDGAGGCWAGRQALCWAGGCCVHPCEFVARAVLGRVHRRIRLPASCLRTDCAAMHEC